MATNTLSSTDKNVQLLLVGQNEDEIRNIADALASDYPISAAPNIQEAAQRLEKVVYNVILFDLGDDGSHLVNSIESLQEYAPGTPIIVIGDQHDSQLIVRAVKAGAFDFVTRPYSPEKIKLSVHQALEHRRLKNEIDYLRREQDVVYDREKIIAASGTM